MRGEEVLQLLRMFILIVGQNVFIPPSQSAPVEENTVYAIIFDAGSSGTRAWAFKFQNSEKNGDLVLKDSKIAKVTPGLSDYSKTPDKGVESVAQLLREVEDFVPETERSRTLVALGATAGVRRLPDHESRALITGVQQFLSSSPYLTSNGSASILSGSTEGIYGWIAVNFLAGRLHGETFSMSAALDMGGYSTQVTYPHPDHGSLPRDDIYSIFIPGYWTDRDFISLPPPVVRLYSKSYMGLGLAMARVGILSMGNSEDSTIVSSPCISPVVQGSFQHLGVNYTVKGSPERHTKKRITKCSKLVKQYVAMQNITKASGILDFDTVAFSNFYRTALDADLIDASKDGGSINVIDIERAAHHFCWSSLSGKKLFLCQDLLYVATLLKDGYGFLSRTRLKVVEKLAGTEVSWALGAALHLLQTV